VHVMVDDRAERVRLAGHVGAGAPYSTYRIRFAKLGRAAFLGHLDLVRLLARSFRRAGLPVATTRGFSPKPRITFGPALGLGVPSLGELMDVDIEHGPAGEHAPAEIQQRLAEVVPEGIELHTCAIVRLAGHPLAQQPDRGLGKLIDAVDLILQREGARLDQLAAEFLGRTSAPIARGEKTIDVRALVTAAEVIEDSRLTAALDWPHAPLLRVRVRATSEGSARPVEVAAAFGLPGALVARLGVVAADH